MTNKISRRVFRVDYSGIHWMDDNDVGLIYDFLDVVETSDTTQEVLETMRINQLNKNYETYRISVFDMLNGNSYLNGLFYHLKDELWRRGFNKLDIDFWSDGVIKINAGQAEIEYHQEEERYDEEDDFYKVALPMD